MALDEEHFRNIDVVLSKEEVAVEMLLYYIVVVCAIPHVSTWSRVRWCKLTKFSSSSIKTLLLLDINIWRKHFMRTFPIDHYELHRVGVVVHPINPQRIDLAGQANVFIVYAPLCKVGA